MVMVELGTSLCSCSRNKPRWENRTEAAAFDLTMSPEMLQGQWEPELLKADVGQAAWLHPSHLVALGPSWTSEGISRRENRIQRNIRIIGMSWENTAKIRELPHRGAANHSFD